MEPGATDDSDRGEARAELDRLAAAIAQSTADGNTYVAASLHFKAAQICLASTTRREVATREEALAHLWASWQLQPNDLDVRTVLAHYLERDNQLDEAANLYRSSAEHIQNEKERTALLLRAADLLRLSGELDEALLVLRQIAPVRDQELAAQRLRAIRTLYAALGEEMVAERIEALGLLLPFLEGDERFEQSLQLARLHAQLGDEEAAQTAYREALAVRPAAPEALEPVRRHLQDNGTERELSEVLETAARHAAREAQLPLLRELAQLADTQLEDPGRAVRFHWKAWELDPASTHEPEQLKRIYAETEQWTRYRSVLEQEALRAPDTESKVRAYRELATLLQQVFEDEASAAGVYGFILHLVPDDEAARAARPGGRAGHRPQALRLTHPGPPAAGRPAPAAGPHPVPQPADRPSAADAESAGPGPRREPSAAAGAARSVERHGGTPLLSRAGRAAAQVGAARRRRPGAVRRPGAGAGRGEPAGRAGGPGRRVLPSSARDRAEPRRGPGGVGQPGAAGRARRPHLRRSRRARCGCGR
jgi:tetratricopeptide (TPR) repeat protein